jgi:hypothetical protein
MKVFKDLLINLKACSEAIEWAGDRTIEEVVENCHRGDWLLWLAQKIDIDKRNFTLAKAHCANTVRHLMKDERSTFAVDTAIKYGEGKASDKDLEDAADAAADAAAAYADAAADAAAYAAYAAADAAAYGAAAAAAYAAEKENQLQTADICRKYIGESIIERVNELINQLNNN